MVVKVLSHALSFQHVLGECMNIGVLIFFCVCLANRAGGK
jgi:hypothetical protein